VSWIDKENDLAKPYVGRGKENEQNGKLNDQYQITV